MRKERVNCDLLKNMGDMAGLLTINSLMASTEWLLPVQVHYLALNGLDQLFMTALSLKHRLDHHLSLTGLICTLFDGRTRLSREIENELRRLFGRKKTLPT